MSTDIFYEISDNPPPEKAAGGFLTTPDRKKIRYGRFPATARPLKGTVVILPGRNECIEKYFETGRNLAERGFGSAILDWRGQGGSDRLLRDRSRGHIGSFKTYVRDLDQFFEEVVLPDCRGPYYILAHSTGSLVALLAAGSMINRVRRMILLTPLLKLTGYPITMKTLRRMTTALTWLGLGRLYAAWGPRPAGGTPFTINKLTSDLDRYQRNMLLLDTYPQLQLGGPTIAWTKAACEAADAVQRPEFIAKLQIPVLFIAAGADEVVSTKAIEDYARSLRPGSLLTIDGARHEILQEADIFREQFFAAFDAFIPGNDPED